MVFQNFAGKHKDSPAVKVKEEMVSGKEPTPEWKKSFIQQMREPSPVGMVMDNLATKRPNSCVSSSTNKTARNLFSSDGNSPNPPDALGIFKDPSHQPSELERCVYKTPSHANPPFADKVNLQFNDTPVPAKKFAQQQSFEFKQPILPTQKPKEATQPDLIVVNNIPYRKGEKLGKGGSSDVFQVIDDRLLILLPIL
jgi:hypothetical protein